MTIILTAALALAAPLAPVQAAPPPAATPPTTAAPDAGRMAAARRLVDLLHLEALYDRMFAQLTPVLSQGAIGAMSADADGRQFVAALDAAPDGRSRFSAILAEEYRASMQHQYPALKQAMAAEYAALFTREELEAIAAFYSTGPGAKILSLQSELQQRMSRRGQELGRIAGAEAGVRAVKRASREILGRPEKPTT